MTEMMTMTPHRYYFFGGKGGTGKTSTASSYAMALSQAGYRTLVVSTDPAHSLADVMGVPVGYEITSIQDNLWAIEIDPEIESKKYMKSIQDQMLNIVSAAIVEEIKKQLRIAYLSPGSEEAAIFDKFVELMELAGERFDCIVFDTAPTGQTLRLLTLPEILGIWIDHLVKKRIHAVDLMRSAARYEKALQEKLKEDPILDTLNRRKKKFERARSLLTDSKLCSFYFVLNPEKLPVLETERAVKVLDGYRINVGAVVVNRVIGPEAGSFFEKKRASQEKYLRQIEDKFGDVVIIRIPMLDSDVEGMEQLQQIADIFRKNIPDR